jgi:uncharacterized membrane protein YfcA
MMNLEPWQWLLAVTAALLVGVSKTGIAGLGILPVVLFANIFPVTKQATGLVLPLLIVGDLVAVASYRRHTQWTFLWKLFPWTALGVVIGFFALDRIADHATKRLIGVLLHLGRRRAAAGADVNQAESEKSPEFGAWLAPVVGVLAGFTTLVANAAGPLMAIYLLAMGLPKLAYVGTGAIFFMLLNWFKVPFMVNLGLITAESLRFNALLVPAVLAGALVGRWLLQKIDQKPFENLALGLSALAGLNLVFDITSPKTWSHVLHLFSST